MNVSRDKNYRPYVMDPKGKNKRLTKNMARRLGLRIDTMQTKIYETGLAVFENNAMLQESHVDGK